MIKKHEAVQVDKQSREHFAKKVGNEEFMQAEPETHPVDDIKQPEETAEDTESGGESQIFRGDGLPTVDPGYNTTNKRLTTS